MWCSHRAFVMHMSASYCAEKLGQRDAGRASTLERDSSSLGAVMYKKAILSS